MKTRYPKRKNGFTLIELMIVVAILGILASVALPAYQLYTAKSQLSEAFVLVGPVQRAVVDYYARWGRFPDDNATAGVPEPAALRGRFVRRIEVKQGGMLKVEVHPTSRATPPASFYLRPVTRDDGTSATVVWICNNGTKSLGDGFKATGEIGKDFFKDDVSPAACRSS